MPGNRACPVRREAIRKRTRASRAPRRMADPAGIHLREHGHAAATDDALTVAFAELRAGQVTTEAACALIGRPRASHYRRHLLGPLHGPREARTVAESQPITVQTDPPEPMRCNRNAYEQRVDRSTNASLVAVPGKSRVVCTGVSLEEPVGRRTPLIFGQTG